MNCVFIGNFYSPSWDGSVPDEVHIAEALEELGHKVLRTQREDNLQYILHNRDGWDMILFSQWDGYPDTLIANEKELPMIDALRENFSISWKLGEDDRDPPKIVYWAFDYQADGQEWHEKLIKASDLYLSKRIADSKYPNWQWLSQDFAPKFLDKHPSPLGKDIDVLFTGSYLPWATERNETLKAVDEKFNLVIHSVNEWPGFKDVRPPIMDEGLPELYARAKVILSIDHTLEAGYWSDRNAQIMACGRTPLFRYIPLSETTFHHYVNYFYSVDDCLKQIEWLLENDNPLSDEITYQYAQNYLKVRERVKDLLTVVKGNL